jgi:hypothetical protein
MATARSTPNSRTSKAPKRPKLNNGGNETNLNDLVNFQLPPRRTHYMGPRRHNKKVTTYTPWARERQWPFSMLLIRSRFNIFGL